MAARSYLYVPGNDADGLERGLASEADALIVDLEGTVPAEDKSRARELVSQRLSKLSSGPEPRPRLWLRLNAVGAEDSTLDQDVEAAVHEGVTGVILAKCESRDELRRLDEALTRAEQRRGVTHAAIAVSALIESAAGVLAMTALARAPRVVRMQLGEGDLIADLGLDPAEDNAELLAVRTSLVVASAAASLERPSGSVHRGAADTESVRMSSEALRRQGFFGRGAVTEVHLAIINQVFSHVAAPMKAH